MHWQEEGTVRSADVAKNNAEQEQEEDGEDEDAKSVLVRRTFEIQMHAHAQVERIP